MLIVAVLQAPSRDAGSHFGACEEILIQIRKDLARCVYLRCLGAMLGV
jgi:hypothetical protein